MTTSRSWKIFFFKSKQNIFKLLKPLLYANQTHTFYLDFILLWVYVWLYKYNNEYEKLLPLKKNGALNMCLYIIDMKCYQKEKNNEKCNDEASCEVSYLYKVI